MNTRSIPSYQSLPLTGVTSPREWLKYSVEIESLVKGADELLYFVEKGQPIIMTENELGAELFNAALLKVNVSDTESVLSFVQTYGIPASTLYEGHQRLVWFRNRNVLPFVSLNTITSHNSNFLYSDIIASFDTTAKTHSINPCGGKYMESVLVPAYYSEIARANELDNKSTVGVVSLLEVAQTIRLLQCATAICTAFQAESEKGTDGDIENAASYITNDRFLRKDGARYFLSDPDLLSFDSRCENDFEFLQNAKKWAEQGNDPRFIYSKSEIEAFYAAALNALTFLQNSYSVSKLPLSIPSSTDNKRHSFHRFNKKREESSDSLLVKVSEYGSLTEAIIQQYLFLLCADSPWQECENCGRFFKRAREAKPGKKLRKTRFCSRSCNVSFNKKKTAE